MEIKHNDATRNRPKGDRVIDAPYVFADLPVFIDQVKDEKAWKQGDRNAITVFKSDGMTLVLSVLKEGAVIKDNTVDGFLTLLLLEGKMRLETLEGDIEIEEQQLVTFHPGVPHSIEAMTGIVLLITTHDSPEK